MSSRDYPADTTPDQRTRLHTAQQVWALCETLNTHRERTVIDLLTPACDGSRERAKFVLAHARATETDLADAWGAVRDTWMTDAAPVPVSIQLELASHDFVNLYQVGDGWHLEVIDHDGASIAALTNDEIRKLVLLYQESQSGGDQ